MSRQAGFPGRFPHATSLAGRLAIGTTVITSGVVAAAAVVAWWFSWWAASADVDQRLHDLKSQAEQLISRGPPPGFADKNLLPPPKVPGGLLVRFRTGDGQVMWASAEFPPRLPPLTAGEPARTIDLGTQRVRALCLFQGAIPVGHPITAMSGATSVTVDGAIDLTEQEKNSRHLAVLLGLLWLGSTVFAGLSSLALRKLLIAPVATLSQQISLITPDRLSQRIPPTVPDELAPIVARTNELLARLEEAFQREKDTINTIAHELRTPVTIQRGFLEFAMLNGDRPLDPEVAKRCLGAAVSMHRLIDDLLALARMEAGLQVPDRQPLDLRAIVQRAWELQSPRTSDRELTLDDPQRAAAFDQAALIESAAGLTEAVVASLLGNAIDHAPAGGRITLGWQVSTTTVALTVINRRDGEAFRASTSARTSDAVIKSPHHPHHLGLGLPLCRRMMLVLRGSLVCEEGPESYSATVTFPRHRG